MTILEQQSYAEAPKSNAADIDLCQRVLAGEEDAGREFFFKYYRRIGYFANKMANPNLLNRIEIEDIKQDFWVYALECIGSYLKYTETNQGAMPFVSFFSNYAPLVVRDTVENESRLVHVSGLQLDRLRKIFAINSNRAQQGRRMMDDEEIAAEFGVAIGPPTTPEGVALGGKVTTGDLRQAELLARYLGSIDIGFSPRTDTSPGLDYDLSEIAPMKAAYADAPPVSVEDSYNTKDIRAELEKILDKLSERETMVVKMRFGIDTGTPKTLGEIGKELGLNRERVRQIESKIMAKLRHLAHSEQLSVF